MKTMKKYSAIILLVVDVLIIASSYVIAYFLLNNSNDIYNGNNIILLKNSIMLSIIIYEIIFNIFSIYNNITKYETGNDYLVYMGLCIVSLGFILLSKILFPIPTLGVKYLILASMVILVGVISYRVIVRFVLASNQPKVVQPAEKKNLLIIGAGDATIDIIKTIKTKMRNTYNIIGIIDDNETKKDRMIAGVRVLGNRYDIPEICKLNSINSIFFCISNIEGKEKREILNLCQETGAKLRVLPSTEDFIKGKQVYQNLREAEIDDILGREPITLENKKIEELIKGKPILVTGGGGSIGSELCRQIIKYKPSKLIIFDIYENNLYDIQMELKGKQLDKTTKVEAIVGSVRDKKRLEKIFEEYRPYLVFHAAAHKHVPLMEKSPLEAIKNNVFGTYNVADYSDRYGVAKFILISTDKAVNPTNIMGASKRLCEMIIQSKNKTSKTDFAAVRFGNVLGSNGSVVPLFKKQIAAGGPITITHKEITRFFMTIPEAVGLVLQAMSYARGGEIFVLDMGEPVKIYDLAVSLIRLSGLEPNVDIEIKEVGLRPGEKLYEELLLSEEGLEKTEHKKIFISELSDISKHDMADKLERLRRLTDDERTTLEQLKKTMRDIVPTYCDAKEVNKEVKNSRREIEAMKKIIKGNYAKRAEEN